MRSEREMQFRRVLRRWWREARRPFPWRETEDPYRILVSEIMLQQTQAARVVPYYETFLRRYPTVHVLARAPQADVVRLWSGLGYNRRAVALHRAAYAMAHEWKDNVSTRLSDLTALPGVGDYTARAVLAFAYNKNVAPVDTNIRRILMRHFGKTAERDVQAFADSMVPRGRARDWASMLMDFGALVCTAKNPSCSLMDLKHILEPRPGVRQKPFANSDRFWRGRFVEALRVEQQPITIRRLRLRAEGLADMRITSQRAEHLVSELVIDGLIRRISLSSCSRLTLA